VNLLERGPLLLRARGRVVKLHPFRLLPADGAGDDGLEPTSRATSLKLRRIARGVTRELGPRSELSTPPSTRFAGPARRQG
jgi:hypothetical protein